MCGAINFVYFNKVLAFHFQQFLFFRNPSSAECIPVYANDFQFHILLSLNISTKICLFELVYSHGIRILRKLCVFVKRLNSTVQLNSVDEKPQACFFFFFWYMNIGRGLGMGMGHFES